MNIFLLSNDPRIAAKYHCDKHVVKMLVEYAQLLSTAHRQLDGTPVLLEWEDAVTMNGAPWGSTKRRKNLLVLEGESPYIEYETTSTGDDDNNVFETSIGTPTLLGRLCYNSTHHNHPSAVWARKNSENYCFLRDLFLALSHEYTARYYKHHAVEKLFSTVLKFPKNIPIADELTPFPQAMPDQYKHEDPVQAYRNYYVGDKARFAKWTNTPVPKWFLEGTQKDESEYSRSR